MECIQVSIDQQNMTPNIVISEHTKYPRLLALANIVRYEPPTFQSEIRIKKPPVEQKVMVSTIDPKHYSAI